MAGRPSDPEIEARIVDLATRDPRVRLHLAHIDDRELVGLVGESELVVLPYSQMHNSGALLTTLSLGRPALVPANEVNALIAAEVGRDWVLHTKAS